MEHKRRKLTCSADVADLIPEALAREFQCFPLRCFGNVMTIAVSAPLSDEAQEKIRFLLNREIEIREKLHRPDVIQRSLDALYGEQTKEEDITYYRPWHCSRAADGTIIIPATGYSCGCHWTGCVKITPDHPDFEFWTWIIARSDRFEEIISDDGLKVIREEFQGTRDPTRKR